MLGVVSNVYKYIYTYIYIYIYRPLPLRLGLRPPPSGTGRAPSLRLFQAAPPSAVAPLPSPTPR
ncbi:putative basic proline-rich protein-like [Iris pallida]|uniref:Basic proline-rich protein-like n=1 Tax=Iris pallida TaxID=29817 RepID=A0AAX6G0C0_IRIPA|nr:putative basic proline-rich protein-like [Iris pallida]